MSFLNWTGLTGALLLLMALASAYVRRLPVTTSAIYLAIGLIISPLGLALVNINFIEWRVLFENLTQIVIIVSLFIGGLKLRLPLRNPVWTAAYRLAGPVMIASIAGVAVVVHFGFGFGWAESTLLGAMLAPTDPVLAGTVTVSDSADHDRMRYGLSGEAGFNDGAAFPFVIFALEWQRNGDLLAGWVGEWMLHRIIWAIPVALIGGYLLGQGVGRFAIWLRSHHRETEAPNDFLALALIALAYFGAETISAWGFLAVFAAGIGFRRAEIKVVEDHPADEQRDNQLEETGDAQLTLHPPAEEVVGRKLDDAEIRQPAKAAGLVVSEILSFGDTAERLLEVLTVTLVGICLATYWNWRALPLALLLFFLIRPLSTLVFLLKTPTGKKQRLMMGWFGIRGIGSLYYLAYALNHGLSQDITELVGITLSVVALSVLIHGVSSQPILNFYERAIASQSEN